MPRAREVDPGGRRPPLIVWVFMTLVILTALLGGYAVGVSL